MSQSVGGRTGRTFCLESKDCLPDIASSPLKRIPFNGFNKIKVSVRILGTSPVLTCTCEQSFFAMRRLEIYARYTMVSERLMTLYSYMFIRK